jgi:hypothetical protein
LWVNIRVITPLGFSTRRHSAKIAAIPLLVVAPGQSLGARLALELGGIGDRFVFLIGERTGEEFGNNTAGGTFEPDIEEVG